MGQQTTIFLLLILISFPCFSKEIVQMRDFQQDTWLSKDEKERAKKSIFCHVRHHLGEYTDYIFKNVTPRMAKEIPQLISRQVDTKGEFVQIGERLSRGDLFHGHVRVPIMDMLEDEQGGLHPIFKNDEKYHFQYHSFETHELFTNQWIEELDQIENLELQNWILQLKARRNFRTEDMDYTSGAYGSGPQPPPVEILSEEMLNRFSRLWYDQQTLSEETPQVRNWLLERYKKKLQLLDPNQVGGGASVLSNRSVMTTKSFIGILRALNLSDYMQPANIYFARRSDYKGLNAVILKAEQKGLNKILNPDSRHFETGSFTVMDMDFHRELSASLRQTFAQENIEKSIFSNIAHSDREFSGLQAYSWDEDFIFAIRYSILCD